MLCKMRNGDILRDYGCHLLALVEDKRHELNDYSLMLETLFDIPFICSVEIDKNREKDAFNLRTDICEEYDTNYSVVLDRNISVLEVLIALAMRIENDILGDPMSGEDRTTVYFWDMLRNLDIEKYRNDNFREANIRDKVEKWLFKEYKKDGSGSIFPLKNPCHDARCMDIWSQMQAYLMENY